MGLWARLAQLTTEALALPADTDETPAEQNAREIRAWEQALAEGRRYAALACAAERRLARELDRHRSRVAAWERRVQEVPADLAGPYSEIQRHHEELLADLQAHYDAARADVAGARQSLRLAEIRLTEARLVQGVLRSRELKQ